MSMISISYDTSCQHHRGQALIQKQQAVLNTAKDTGDAGDVEFKGEEV